MTPEQVAQYLQLTTDTVYRLIRRKELAATKIGRHYRVPRADLESFLASHSTRKQIPSHNKYKHSYEANQKIRRRGPAQREVIGERIA